MSSFSFAQISVFFKKDQKFLIKRHKNIQIQRYLDNLLCQFPQKLKKLHSIQKNKLKRIFKMGNSQQRSVKNSH